MAQQTDALVIGAGVVGLTTAVCLAEHGFAVRVRTNRLPRETTSAVAGAIIGGPLIADAAEAEAKFSPLEITTPWHRASMDEFSRLAERPGTGVRMTRGRLVNRQGTGSEWAKDLPGYQPCSEEESAGYPAAFWTTMPIVDMPAYLGHLYDRLTTAGGGLEVGEVTSLDRAAAEARLKIGRAHV